MQWLLSTEAGASSSAAGLDDPFQSMILAIASLGKVLP